MYIRQMILMITSLLFFPSCSKEEGNKEVYPPISVERKLIMTIGNTTFDVSLYNNSTAEAFYTMLPITINMDELNRNEKYCNLPEALPTAGERISTINNGDIMLYGSQTLVLFYETFSNSYRYTRIGKVDNIKGLKEAVGTGSVSIKFE